MTLAVKRSTTTGEHPGNLTIMASFYAGNIVGHTLGNRYRLLNLLGMGSSARVYLAEDVKLRRRVAVKLLHASLASDESFLRRFQREAESLAPLTHSNIVIIFDYPDRHTATDEPPFLVTEYLSGGSLRNLLDSGALLTPAQAAVVGLGAARGLTFAHAHGVVHRDIKPANLLFGDDQRVRIGDFGLARALADYGRTEPAGALVGTAKYLSPEQARGTSNLNGRSDVYSLALVLYEAITGEVPFTADTWQGTAMARLQSDLVVAPSFGPLGAVLEAAATIDPERRLDAEGFVIAIEAAIKQLPPPERLLLDGARVLSRAAQLDERDPTLFASSRSPERGETLPNVDVDAKTVPRNATSSTAATSDDFTSYAPSSLSVPSVAPSTRAASGLPNGSAPQATDTTHGRVAVEPDASSSSSSRPRREKPPRPARRWRKVLVPLFAVMLLAGVGTGVAISRRTPTHVVPDLTGMTQANAQKSLKENNFGLIADETEFNDAVPTGAIIRQTPLPGEVRKEKQTITVVLSKGLKPIDVPDLSGLSLETAIAKLEGAGLRSSNPPQFRVDEIVEAGHIVGWNPRNAVAPESLITLVVSSGPAAVALPRVRGLKPEAAIKLLPAGVTATLIEIFSDTKSGLVSGSDPKSATLVRSGDVVKIFVSKGPELVTVPNVINRLPADAAAAIRAAGLSIGDTFGPVDQPILHTRPLRNTKAKRGTKVTFYTTEENVPEVPGVAATRATSTTGVARPLPIPTTTAAP